MQRKICSLFVRAAAIGATTLTAMLAGCGVNLSTASTDYTNAVQLQGQVFAGRNYMAGARVKIYSTQSNGVATNGAYVGTAKLLASVTANATGGWSLQNVSCSSPDQIYVTAEGGVPYPMYSTGSSAGALSPTTTLSDNQNSLMMTAIGDCSLLTSTSSSLNNTTIVTNEASTVAAVFALKNFISLNGTTVNVTSSATNYAGANGVGVAGNYAGLIHAFLDANELAPYKKGAFQQFTNEGVSDTTGGVIPVQLLNGLAYIQYLCTIGGTGGAGDYSYCTQLYTLTTPPTSGATAPTNSLAAMLNIAKYPTNNATPLVTFAQTPIPYTLQTGSQAINGGVYVPAITGFGTYPPTWAVAIAFMPAASSAATLPVGNGFGATTTGQGIAYPTYLTVDANDSVYVSNPSASTSTGSNIIAIRSNGASLWTAATDTTYKQYNGIAADANGHIWVANYNSSTLASSAILEFSASSGTLLNTFPSTSLSLINVAVDTLGNVWYDSSATTGANVHELLASSSYAEASFPVTLLSTTALPKQIRVDANNNIWLAGYAAASARALYLPNTGTVAAPTYTTGLMSLALPTGIKNYGITPDASGNAYVPTGAGPVYKVSVTGSGASATLSSQSVGTSVAASTADTDTDGNGVVWYTDQGASTYMYTVDPASGTTTTYQPCYYASTTSGTATETSTASDTSSTGYTYTVNNSQACGYSVSSRWDLALDSTGSLWVASYANKDGGRLFKIIGVAAPTVPLHSLGKAGVMP